MTELAAALYGTETYALRGRAGEVVRTGVILAARGAGLGTRGPPPASPAMSAPPIMEARANARKDTLPFSQANIAISPG